ncbi:hypothetical protein GCM10027066_06730 [Dyella jejuensis]
MAEQKNTLGLSRMAVATGLCVCFLSMYLHSVANPIMRQHHLAEIQGVCTLESIDS